MQNIKEPTRIRKQLARMRERLVQMDESMNGVWADAKCRFELRWLAFTAMRLDAGKEIKKTFDLEERSALDLSNLAGRNGRAYRDRFNKDLKRKRRELAVLQAEIARLESVLNADLTIERKNQARQAAAFDKLLKIAGRKAKE
jgi:hypothetical protein